LKKLEKIRRTKIKKAAKKGSKKVKTEIEPLVENLKKEPYLLKDGDIIGYRLENDDLLKEDDFHTFEDEENQIKFLEERARQTKNSGTKSRGGKSEPVFKIKMDDEEF